MLFAFVVIGQNDYFGIGLLRGNENRSFRERLKTPLGLIFKILIVIC